MILFVKFKLPPIRSKNKTNSTTPSPIATGVQDKNNNGKVTDATKAKKKQKIKSYDYDAWSKFDVVSENTAGNLVWYVRTRLKFYMMCT